MLDRFIVGRVTRISPEAPVPVVAFDHEMHRIGGAANVAHNVAALGGARHAGRGDRTGRSGGDARAGAAATPGIAPSLRRRRRRGRTTTKVRIVTERNQQVARIDYEEDAEIAGEIEQRVVAAVQQHARARRGHRHLRLSEGRRHAAAWCAPAIAAAAARGVPVLVDPKIPHIDYYAGATRGHAEPSRSRNRDAAARPQPTTTRAPRRGVPRSRPLRRAC